MELGLDEAFAGDIAAYVRQGGEERETYELCSAYAMKKGNYDKAIEIYEKQLDEPVAEAGAVNQKEVFTETKEN